MAGTVHSAEIYYTQISAAIIEKSISATIAVN